MRIKQPYSDKPLRIMDEMLQKIDQRIQLCHSRNHDFLSIIYWSSYVFTDLNIHGRLLSNIIGNLSRGYNSNVVCLVRTVSPLCLPRFNAHRAFCNRIRHQCYLVVYDSRSNFLNHAKFILWLHFCLSEEVMYHMEYYGSTNFTYAGMSNRSGNRPVGNYEEYYYSRYITTFILPRQTYNTRYIDEKRLGYFNYYLYLLREVRNQLNHIQGLYFNRNYLVRILNDQINRLSDVIDYINRIIHRTTLGELYDAFISGWIEYLRSLALLDQLPGRKLTMEFVDELLNIKKPISASVLENMITSNLEDAESKAKEYEYTKEQLIKENKELIKALIKTRKLIGKYAEELKHMDLDEFYRKYCYKDEESRIEQLRKSINIQIEKLDNIIERISYSTYHRYP